MLGAIIGDIVGSRHEFNNYPAKDFVFLTDRCCFTDDSVMTVAVADALLRCGGDWSRLSEQAVASMQGIGRKYPRCGYGSRFIDWMFTDRPKPYNSFGNGSAMRVSAVAWAAESLEECKALSRKVTVVSHDHPEGIKGAEATAVATWMGLHGASREEILACIDRDYYRLDFTIDQIRLTYIHNETCQDSVPQALEAFAEGRDFEDVIRTAVSLGGDSDTIAAIAGAVAEACYGIPIGLREQIMTDFLDTRLARVVKEFEARYGMKLA